MSEQVMPSKIFVGRLAVLKKLDEEFKAMVKGQGKCLLISGEAGIGKTTLIGQFRQQTVQAWNDAAKQTGGQSVRFAWSRCNDMTTAGDPYAPFAEILDNLMSQGYKPYNKALERFGPKLFEAVPWVGPVLAEAATLLFEKRRQATIFTIDQVTPESLVYQYIELITELAYITPLVIFLDDLHWADASSVNLLQALSRRVVDHKIMIVGTYRPLDIEATIAESPHPLKKSIFEMRRYKSVSILELDYLPNRELIEFLKSGYPGLDNNKVFTSWLYDYSEGWPMCMVEVMLWLESSGHVLKQNGTYFTKSNVDLNVMPDSLLAIVQKRLESLKGELAKTLRYASVQGEDFNSRILATTLQINHLQLLDRLQTLANIHRIIEEKQNGSQQNYFNNWVFKHSLVHRIVYDSSSIAERTALHREIAAACERLYPKDIERIAGVLAVHYENGELYAKAANLRCQAAYEAKEIKSFEESLLHSEKGINDINYCRDDKTYSPSTEIDLLRLNAMARAQLLQNLELALQRNNQAFELATKQNDLARMLANLVHLYYVVTQIGSRTDLFEFIWKKNIELWSVFLKNGDYRLAAWLSFSELSQQNPWLDKHELIDNLMRMEKIADEKNDLLTLILVNYGVGLTYSELDIHKAQLHFEKALRQLSQLNMESWYAVHNKWSFFPKPSRIESLCLECLGNLHRKQGKWKLAINHYLQVAERSRQNNDLLREAGFLNLIATTWLLAGEFKLAREAVEKAKSLAEKSDSIRTIAIILSTAIDVVLLDYDIPQSEILIKEFQALTSGTDISWANQKVLRSRGLLCILQKDMESAQNWLEQAINESHDTGARLRYGLDLAIVEAAMGMYENAKEPAHEIIDYYRDRPNRGAAEALLLLSRIATRQGLTEDAKLQDLRASEILQDLHLLHRKPEFYKWIDHAFN